MGLTTSFTVYYNDEAAGVTAEDDLEPDGLDGADGLLAAQPDKLTATAKATAIKTDFFTANTPLEYLIFLCVETAQGRCSL